ncbi:MAG: hypothetical protein HQK82_01105 [Desulfovibrionaceae bacterium]|nr:hypothetical protein [Desulfovibrionaceae bacterium]
MYLDQNIINTATSRKYQTFLSLLHFHLLQSSEGMKFDSCNKLEKNIVTIPDGFSSAIRKARSIETHVYLTFRCGHSYLVLYFCPDSMVSQPEHERLSSDDSLFPIKRFRVMYSFLSGKHSTLHGEDYFELYELLIEQGLYDQIETELERIKLLNV